MICVSLPADTPLGLPGGVWELRRGQWVHVEPKRWWYEDGRIRADYTREEAIVVLAIAEHSGSANEPEGPTGSD